MKVKELIEILKLLDQEKEIRHMNEGFPSAIEEVQNIDNYYYIN